MGMAKDKIEKIFDRFERASTERAAQEGLGLGLFITRQIVEAHAGKIWVDSEVGKGSTFYVQLPCFNQPENISDKNQADFVKELQ